MATTFFTPVAPVELPATNIGAWTNTVSLDTYATVPAGATHVLLETTYTGGTSSPGYGFQNGDDTTNFVYPAKIRFTRFDWVLINTAKTLSLYVNVASTVKFYVRGYSNHIVPVSSLDMSSSVPTNTITTITCSSLPADAAGGAAVFIYNAALATFSNVGAGAGLGYYAYIDKQMEIVPLNSLKQFDIKQPTAGGLTANQLVLVGYIPVGRFVGNPNPGAELITPASTWMDTANVDLAGAYDVWRYRGTTVTDLFGFGTGGSTSNVTTLNPKTNPLYIAPNGSTGKSTFWSNSIGAGNGAYYVGYFAPTFTDKIVGGTDTISRGIQGTTLHAPGLNSVKSLKIGTLHGDSVVGSSGLFNFNFPNFVSGQTYPAYGSYSLAVTDGTTTINGTVSLVPRSNETTVTITNIAGVGPGYLQNYVPLAVGDVVTYKTPASLNVVNNAISASGVITTDYVGVQVLWVRSTATGIMTKVSITTDTLNNTPNVWVFPPVTFAPLSTVTTSNTITVGGLSTTAAISIVGGTFSKNGAAYTSTASTVTNGDTVAVRVTSPAALGLSATATLSIGLLSDEFTVYTTPLYAVPTAFSFTATTGAATSSTATSNTVTIAGIESGTSVPITITGGTYSKNGGAYTAADGVITVGDTLTLRQVASASISTLTSATVNVANVSATWNVTTSAGAADTTPDAFTFTPQTAVARSSTIESNSITVAGVDAGQNVAISITGGQYAVNSGSGFGAFTSSPTTVQLGYVVKVNLTSSALFNTAASATLTIGGVTGTFTATTLAADVTPNAFTFTDATNQALGAVIESNAITIAGVDSGQDVPISVTGGEYAVNTGSGFGAYTAVSGVVQLGHTVKVRGTSSSSSNTSINVTLTVGGVSDIFTITTLTADVTPDAFAFTDVTGQALSSVIESNVITIAGVTAGQNIAVTVAGGEYAINTGGGFGAFTASAGTVQLGNTVKVRGTSSASNSTTTNVALTVGGVTDTFSITTLAAVDLTPNAYTFTDVTGQTRSATIESNVITITGVDAGQNVAITVTGGEYAINTGSGFGPFVSTAGNVQLNHTVKVRGVASASYSTATNVVLTVGGISDTFTITTLAAPAPTLVSINAGAVRANSTGNTVTTTGYTAATGLTIGGVAMTAFTGSGNNYTFSVPALANGIVYPPMGTATATITDGTTPANLSITFAPKATQGYVTLTSVVVAVGYVGNYITCTVGDQIIFDLPATLAVTANGVDVDGRFFSDYSGTQTMYHRNHTTGVLTELSVITPAQVAADVTPDAFSFASVTGVEFSTNATSAATVVAGITAATPVAISVSGGTYSKNGGAYTSTAGTVVLGDSVTVRVVSSASALQSTIATLTIGGVSGTFTATTRAVDTIPTAFTFSAVSGGTISTPYVSNTIIVAGVDAGVDVPISITGGQYAIDNGGGFGSYTSSPGNVRLGYGVRVQLTSSSSGNTTVSATVNIGTVNGVYSVGTGVLDTTPDAFAFTAASGLNPSTLVESNSVTVAGMTAGVDVGISVSGGEYAINTGSGFGSFVSTSGVIQNGHIVKVRGTSSAAFSGTNTVTLTIGGVSATYTQGTRVADTVPSAITFATSSSNEISTVVTSASATIAGVDGGVDIPISITNGVYAINTGGGFGAFTASPGVVRLGNQIQVRVVTSGLYNSSASTTVTVGGVGGTFTATTRVADTTPTSFTFTDATNVELLSTNTSSAITVAGVDAGVDIPVTVTNGQYAVNSGSGYGAYTSSPGNVRLGDLVRVRSTGSSSYSTAVVATLTVGGISGTYTATTRAVDTVPDALGFVAVTGATVSTVVESNVVTIAGVDAGVDVAVTIAGGEYAINTGSGFGSYTSSPGVIRLGQTIKLRVNASATDNTLVTATVTIGGIDGAFLVTTAAIIDTTPDAFTFTDQTGVALSSTIESAPITIGGVTAATDVPISVTGGLFAVDPGTGTFGSFSATSTVVRLGYRVKVSVSTGSAYSTATSATVTIGGMSDTFSATTRAADTTPSTITIASSSGIALGTLVVSDSFTVSGVDAGVDIAITVSNCSYSINNGSGFAPYSTSPGVVRLGDQVRLRMNASSVVNTAITGVVTVGGVSANWVVTSQATVSTVPDVPVLSLTNSVFESAAFAVTGVDSVSDVNVSVTNCEYAVNTGSGFGSYTTLAGVVHLNNMIKLRVTVPSTTTTAVTATITLNTVTSNFVVNQSTGTVVADTTPDSYTLSAVNNAAINTLIESNTFTVAGVDAGVDVPVTIANAEYAYNRGSGFSSFRSTAGNLRLGDVVKVRVMSSGSLTTAVTGTITVGGVARAFVVTTQGSADVTPNAFSFSHSRELEPNEEITSTVVSVAGIDNGVAVNISATGCTYSVNAGSGWGAWLSSSTTVRLGYSVRLKAKASKVAGETATVSATIGGVTGQWQLTTTTKPPKTASATASAFTYPIQPSTTAINDNIIRITQSLVPAAINASVSAKSIWSDVVEIVRFTDYTLNTPPDIDYAGFAYKNLPNLITAVRNTGNLGNFVNDYQDAIRYIVTTCWHELTQLITAQPDCDVNTVVIRNSVLTLQCSIGR